MFKGLLATVLFLGSTASASSISSYFEHFDGKSKGAFGSNMMQLRNSRITYNNWLKSGGGVVFQAAFRSEKARELVEEHGVYTGNLFSTNYYELRAEFLLGDAEASNLSSKDNLSKLVEVSKTNTAVFLRAKQMVQNWNLEKLYIQKNPGSGVARGFTARGIAGAEFELRYGPLFVNYYVEEASRNTDLLALIKLVNSSSLISSNNFTRLRAKASALYETYRPGGPKSANVGSARLSQLKDIRDSIHNQLTPEIINMIDAYIARTSPSQGHAELNEIKSLIRSYFARGVVDVKHIAKKGKISTEGLDALNVKSPTLEDLKSYANSLVENRQAMLSSVVALDQKYLHLAYTSTAASFLGDKTKVYISKNRLNADNLQDLTGVLFRILYIEGFLNEGWFATAENTASDFDSYELMYDDLLTQLTDHVKASYAPYTEKWREVDVHMDGIVDDSIRGSSIGLLNDVLDKMD